MLPGLASAGGGVSSERALLVEMPATWLCTLVPTCPGGRGGFGGRGVFGSLCTLGTLIFRGLGGFGGFGVLLWFGWECDSHRTAVPPTRATGGRTGELGGESDSESVYKGESGFGGGKTSPGTVIR